MPMKRITHEANGLKAVFREKLGSDVLDAPATHRLLAEHIGKQLNQDIGKIPNRFWARVIFVTDVMQQTLSLAGEDRFDIPSVDATDDEITDFYDFMMSLPVGIIQFFQDGLSKFNESPLVTGGPDASDLANAPAQDSLMPTA